MGRWLGSSVPRSEPSRRRGSRIHYRARRPSSDVDQVDHGPGSVRYARVTDGMTAGTVAVEVVRSRARSTQVRVTYDLTSLTPAGEAWLDAFEADYDAEIAEWATEIEAALKRAEQRDS